MPRPLGTKDRWKATLILEKKPKAEIINNQKFDLLHKPQYIPSEYFTS